MKKYAFLIITIAVLLTMLSFASCTKQTTLTVTGKLPQHIIWDDGNIEVFLVQAKFDYDDQGRIVKLIHTNNGGYDKVFTIDYKNKKSVKIDLDGEPHLTYKVKGNKISLTKSYNSEVESHDMTLDAQGYITEEVIYYVSAENGYKEMKYQYQDGNLISETKGHHSHSQRYNPTVVEYTYDDKKSPFTHSNTPLWVLHVLLQRFTGNSMSPYISKNNLIESTESCEDYDEASLFSFLTEFDSEGYLIYHTTPTPLCGASDVTISYLGTATTERRSSSTGIESDADFSIYGKWEWTIEDMLNQDDDTSMEMTVNIDNTYHISSNDTKLSGTIEQTDTYQFIFTPKTKWQDGTESEALYDGRKTVSEYHPDSKELMYRPHHHNEYVFRKITEHEFKTYIKFNDGTGSIIPTNIFFSPIEDDGVVLDSLVFAYEKKKHSVNLHGTIEPLHFWTYDPENFYYLSATDYNFDNKMDIAIKNITRSGARTDRFEIFMYNPIIKTFKYHKEISELDEPWVDVKTKTIKMTALTGDNAHFEEYRWEGEKLVQVNEKDFTVGK